MFNTLKNFKDKYQNSSTWTDFFLSLTGLDEMYKKLDEAKNDKEWRRIAEEVLAKQKEQIEKLIKEIDDLKGQLRDQENKEKVQEMGSDSLLDLLIEVDKQADKLGESIRQTQALIEVKKS